MEDTPSFQIDVDTQFSDIIIPTLDTVRSAYILEQVLSSNNCVSVHQSFLSYRGIGKTQLHSLGVCRNADDWVVVQVGQCSLWYEGRSIC